MTSSQFFLLFCCWISDRERENNMSTIQELFRKLKLHIGKKPLRELKTVKLGEVEIRAQMEENNKMKS